VTVETTGEADQLGWRIHVRCACGRREAMKSVRGCLGRAELDLHTLVWDAGCGIPVSRLESRMKCPLCGSRRVALMFDLPKVPNAQIAGMPSR
jgi:hypothetical protein